MSEINHLKTDFKMHFVHLIVKKTTSHRSWNLFFHHVKKVVAYLCLELTGSFCLLFFRLTDE
jgi:hypothetical protein